MKKMLIYEAVISPGEGENIIVRFPDFDMSTFGEGFEEAIAMAYDLMDGRAEMHVGMGIPFPRPTFGHRLEEDETSLVLAIPFDELQAAEDWKWIGVSDAADILGVTAGRVRVMARDKVLPSKREGRNLYVAREAVEARKKTGAKRGRPAKDLAHA